MKVTMLAKKYLRKYANGFKNKDVNELKYECSEFGVSYDEVISLMNSIIYESI